MRPKRPLMARIRAVVRGFTRRWSQHVVVNIDSPRGQRLIRELVTAWCAEGKNGQRVVVQADDFEHLVDDVTMVLKCYGESLAILNAEGTISDPHALAVCIGNRVILAVLGRGDRGAQTWVAAQCTAVANKICKRARIAMSAQEYAQVADAATCQVCKIAEGDIEDTDGPMPLEVLIDYAVYEALAQDLSERHAQVPKRIAHQGEALKSLYKRLTSEFRARLRLYLGTVRIEETYCSCLRAAFFGLSLAQRRLITLAYWYPDARTPSKAIAEDRVALDPDCDSTADTVNTNLSQFAFPPLRSNVQRQFVAAINRLLQQGGAPRVTAVLGQLCQAFLEACGQGPAARAGFLSALAALPPCDPADVDQVASRLYVAQCGAMNLHRTDADFLVNIVRLFLVIKQQPGPGIEPVCAAICAGGIPDPRGRLFSPGIKAMGSALCQ